MTANRFGANSPRTLSGDVNRFDEAGIWYFHPSIFEYSTGPWQPALPPDPEALPPSPKALPPSRRAGRVSS